MTVRGARTITYLAIGILAFVAIRVTTPVATATASVGDAGTMPDTIPTPSWKLSYDSVARGETLVNTLVRGGLSDTAAGSVVRAAAEADLDPRRIPVGLPVAVLHGAPADSQPVEVVVELASDHFLHLTRDSTGWVSRQEILPWKTDTIAIEGTIHSNLYQAMYAADSALPRDAQNALVVKLADDVYEYRVDMSRDLQDGDTFRVLAQRRVLSNGVVRIGDIVAAQLILSGSEIDAVHFTDDKLAGDYFDQNGRSLKAAFLRAPLQFRYISSGFGRRFHPILKLWRNHEGIDYAANAGTPVRAIGAGVVVRAGVASGYGNLIEIRHANGFSSRYGHLRAFARGIHAGVHVDIGETIGYVGMTGLATGPHLHFEFLVHGVQRNPRVALRNVGGDPIPQSLRASFDSLRDRLIATLVARTGRVTTVAQGQ